MTQQPSSVAWAKPCTRKLQKEVEMRDIFNFSLFYLVYKRFYVDAEDQRGISYRDVYPKTIKKAYEPY